MATRSTRFKNLDLNLLVSLDALLQEASVSAAAARLFLSQSAMSGALAKLREHFGDELLVQVGRNMIRTAFAESLVEPLQRLLLQIESTVGASARFNPAQSERCFVIVASDVVISVHLQNLVRRLAQIAPNISLEFEYPGDDPSSVLESGEIDLLIMPEAFCSPDHPRALVQQSRWMAVGWEENETLREGMSIGEFFSLAQVVVRFSRARELSLTETYMRGLGIERRIQVVAPGFMVVPTMLLGTQRISLLQESFAAIVSNMLPLKMVTPPFDPPPIRLMMQHHKVRENDSGLTWLRSQIVEIMGLPAGPIARADGN